ncbi:CRE-TTR-39 protein [Aphelenchoides avenae]|nr:CRE-TTR-39 protein [Aphelenchus avenae]
MKLLAFAILLAGLAAVSYATKQTVGAKGQLTCGEEPIADATVQIYEEESECNLLAETKTDSEGRFELAGASDEPNAIAPRLKILHGCKTLLGVCRRILAYPIPAENVAEGDDVDDWYDIGKVDAEPKRPREKTECDP